jgi:putative nucleotidyltransferase with HDIG domain
MLKRIKVSHLRLGMHIHELCGSWMEHPFWRTKFHLDNADDLRRIVTSGIKEVWIDTAKGLDVETGESPEQVAAAVKEILEKTAIRDALPEQVPMAEEAKRAAKICASAKQAVVSMFEEARMGKAIDAKAVNTLVDDISSSVMRNPNTLISLARLKSVDDYTYMHSVAVCALMIALARQLNLSESDTRDAGMGGLLHDLGKAFTPLEVLNKPGKLTDEEFRIMKAHPEDGHRVLVECQDVGEVPRDICLHHHEKVDGSGYPHRLAGDKISLFAKMGAVCDVYDAVTSNRPYRAGWDPAEAIGKMTEWSSNHFDQQIFFAFVKSVGIYPIGSLIRLSSGMLGVILEQSANSLLAPLVKVFFSAKTRSYVKPEIVDLSRPGCKLKIVDREDAAKWDIKNIDDYWLPML